MHLFDTIYYKVFKAYKDRFKSDIPEMFAISYLVLMVSMHLLALLKLLHLFGMPIHLGELSKIQKIGAIVALYVIFAIRYYFFFSQVVFEKKNGALCNYRPIVLYSLVFFILFFVLILNF